MNGIFYFTAQTGVWKLRRPRVPSNFYCYALPWSTLGKVQTAVQNATLGSGGLEYPREFLEWLAAEDLDG